MPRLSNMGPVCVAELGPETRIGEKRWIFSIFVWKKNFGVTDIWSLTRAKA
jgi:hypothetical protein